MKKIVVLGSGGWGMALGLAAHRKGHDVTLWSPFEQEVAALSASRRNDKLLRGVQLPKEIKITSDISCAIDADVTVIATPSFAVAETAKRLQQIGKTGIIVSVSKGFEKDTKCRLSQVIEREVTGATVVVLSGPSHAEEVAINIPTSLVAASKDSDAAAFVQDAFSDTALRVYTSSDVIGVELGGALKNVIAVAAGLCDGMGLGDNSKAALITRGLTEMTRLGVKMGAQSSTFSGLTGLGDLIVTCTSKHSRNNRFGNLVGKGTSVQDALTEVGTVEGYYACQMAFELSLKYGVYVPIITTCYELLYSDRSIKDVVKELMTRPFKEE
jgi:glycerol-3-phosphate dehydrogenase (NAD(P)+)